VSGDGEAALAVYGLQHLLHGAQGGQRLLHPQCDDVSLYGRDLHARDDLEAVAPAGADFAGLQGAAEVVVVGDRDDIQVGLGLDVVQDLAR